MIAPQHVANRRAMRIVLLLVGACIGAGLAFVALVHLAPPSTEAVVMSGASQRVEDLVRIGERKAQSAIAVHADDEGDLVVSDTSTGLGQYL